MTAPATVNFSQGDAEWERLHRPSRDDLLYAAGIIDGEGCISILKQLRNRSKLNLPYYEVRVVVHMASYRITHWLQSLFSGSVLFQPRPKANCKDQWSWCVSAKDAEHFLRLVYPFLKDKQKQAEYALLCRDTMWTQGRNRTNLLLPEVCGLREVLFRKVRDLKRAVQ